MINPVYMLTKEDRALAEKIGRTRSAAKPEKVRYDRSMWMHKSNDRTVPHILGICGEIAYAKITNKKVDENIYAYGDDTDFDGIEVKTSTYKYRDIELKVPEREFMKKAPRAYVLARIDDACTKVEFIGSISREKFEKIKYEKCHTRMNNFCVTGDMMKKGLAFVEDGVLKIVYFQETPQIEKTATPETNAPAEHSFFST